MGTQAGEPPLTSPRLALLFPAIRLSVSITVGVADARDKPSLSKTCSEPGGVRRGVPYQLGTGP